MRLSYYGCLVLPVAMGVGACHSGEEVERTIGIVPGGAGSSFGGTGGHTAPGGTTPGGSDETGGSSDDGGTGGSGGTGGESGGSGGTGGVSRGGSAGEPTTGGSSGGSTGGTTLGGSAGGSNFGGDETCGTAGSAGDGSGGLGGDGGFGGDETGGSGGTAELGGGGGTAGEGGDGGAVGDGGAGGSDDIYDCFGTWVTIENEDINSHVWSPDSKRVAFTQCNDPSADLIVATPDLTEGCLITSIVGCGMVFDWKGDWILFRKYEGGTATDNEIYKIHPNGTAETRLTDTRVKFSYSEGTVRDAMFVPNHGLIAYRAHHGGGWYDAYTSPDDGSWSMEPLKDAQFVKGLTVSQSGERVAYGVTDYYNHSFDLYTADPDGENEVEDPIATSLSDLASFAFTPNGAHVVYSSEGATAGQFDLYQVAQDGEGGSAKILEGGDNRLGTYLGGLPGAETEQRLTPDGEHLAFLRKVGSYYQTHTLSMSSGEVTRHSFGEYIDQQPRFSPNGQYLSYHHIPAPLPAWPFTTSELVITPVNDDCERLTFDTEPIIEELDSYEFNPLSYNTDEDRLDWWVKTAEAEPFADAIQLSDTTVQGVSFEFAVTLSAAEINSNLIHMSLVDPTTDWVESYGTGEHAAPTKGLGILVYDHHTATEYPGSFTLLAGGAYALHDGSEARRILDADTWVDVSYRATIRYDSETGAYSIDIVDAASQTLFVEASGVMEPGLSLTHLAVSGGIVISTSPVVEDRGWIDNVVVFDGECL